MQHLTLYTPCRYQNAYYNSFAQYIHRNSLEEKEKTQPCWLLLTLMGTETVFAVVVKVVCGGAPEESIITALIGTAVVLLPHKHEGELTELPLCITKLHLHNCGEEGDGVRGDVMIKQSCIRYCVLQPFHW